MNNRTNIDSELSDFESYRKKVLKAEKVSNIVHRIFMFFAVPLGIIGIIGTIIPFLAPITFPIGIVGAIIGCFDLFILSRFYVDAETSLRDKLVKKIFPSVINSDKVSRTFDGSNEFDKSLLIDSGLFPESEAFSFKKNSEVYGLYQSKGSFGDVPFQSYRIEIFKYVFSKGKFVKELAKGLVVGVLEAAIDDGDDSSDNGKSTSKEYPNHHAIRLYSGGFYVVDLPRSVTNSLSIITKKEGRTGIFRNYQKDGLRFLDDPFFIISMNESDGHSDLPINAIVDQFTHIRKSTKYAAGLSIKNNRLYIFIDDDKECIYKNIANTLPVKEDFEKLITQIESTRKITEICSLDTKSQIWVEF